MENLKWYNDIDQYSKYIVLLVKSVQSPIWYWLPYLLVVFLLWHVKSKMYHLTPMNNQQSQSP